MAYHPFLLTSSYPGGFQPYRVGGTGTWQYVESAQDPASGSDAKGRPYDARNAYDWAYPAPARMGSGPGPHGRAGASGNACRALRAMDLMQNLATGGIYRNVRLPVPGSHHLGLPGAY